MLEITIDGGHPDIVKSDSSEFLLSLSSSKVDDTGNSATKRFILEILDAEIPEIDQIQYTLKNEPMIVELDSAKFINWEPTGISYKLFAIDSFSDPVEIVSD